MDDFEKWEEPISKVTGKTIESIVKDINSLCLNFTDGNKLILRDERVCCEVRYMRTDDDLNYYVGSKFLGAEIKDAPNVDEVITVIGEEEHEVQFLEIKTDRGVFTMSNHNKHNGYYGGFNVTAYVAKNIYGVGMKNKIKIDGEIAIIKDTGETIVIYNGIEDGKVWIEKEGGEGGDFDAKEFFDHINAYYKKHF